MTNQLSRTGGESGGCLSGRVLTPTQVLLALAARCEAEEPSRELDEAIYVAAHSMTREPLHPNNGIYYLLVHPDGRREHPDSVDRYTTSLDAAVTLVPEGWIWDVASTGQAWVMGDGSADQHHTATRSQSAPLAICAAALKARASLTDHKG